MKTDVIIISRGQNGLVYRAIDSLHNHSKPEIIGKVCLSWNGDDETLAKVERQLNDLGFDYVVEKVPYNFSQNNNLMVKKHCQSDAVLFLNDDIQLMDNFVEQATELLEKPNVGFVGCKLIRPDNTIQHAGVIAFVDRVGNLVGPAHYCYNKENQKLSDFTPLAVTGACMMCRRELFIELGLFNEEYDEAFQDFDICVKAVIDNKVNVCLNSLCQLHDESITRNKTILPHDSDILVSFWRYHISDLMRSDSPSCCSIIERRTN